MAILQRSELSDTQLNENSVDRMFQTFKTLKESEDKKREFDIEHQRLVQTTNLDQMAKAVEGKGGFGQIDPVTGKIRPFLPEENATIQGARTGQEVYNMQQLARQMQQVQQFKDLMTPRVNPQVASVMGKPVMMSDTARPTPVGTIPTELPKSAEGMSDYQESITLDDGKMKIGIKEKNVQDRLLDRDKRKDTSEVVKTFQNNAVQRNLISDASEAVERFSGGVYGKIGKNFAKNLKPDSPALADFQKIKMVLTNAQLRDSLLLKGAISDTENKWLAEAAANDDLISAPRTKVVLNKAIKFIEAEDKSLAQSYKRNYGDDPMQWDEIKAIKNSSGTEKSSGKQTVKFADDEEKAYQAWKSSQK